MNEMSLTQDKMDAFAQLKLLRSAIAGVTPDDRELAVIDAMMDRLRSQAYTVAVVGEFNRGKSSLINALLGMHILPTDVIPTTATINKVVYAEAPYAKLVMRDGGEETIPFTMLAARITKLSREAETAAALVREAVIGYPTPFCRGNITILDTPGLNESEDMTELTMSGARQSDAVIYIMDARIPFGMTDAEAICRILDGGCVRHILFTVGFIDMIPPKDRERVLDLVRRRTVSMTGKLMDGDDSLTAEERDGRKAIVRDAAVIGVSAKKALNAFVTGSLEDLEDSAIEPCKKELMTRLTVQQDERFATEIRPYVQDVATRFDGAVDRTVDALQKRIDAGSEALAKAYNILDNYEERQARLIADWKQSVWAAACSSLAKNADDGKAYGAQILEAVILDNVTNRTPYYPPSGGGLFERAKEKALEVLIDTGRYRVPQDPINRQLREGFEIAREVVLSSWVPETNRQGQTFIQLQQQIRDLWGKVRGALKEAKEQFAAGDSVLPSWKVNVFSAAPPLFPFESEQRLRDAMPGDVTRGTIFSVANGMARALSNAFSSELDKHLYLLANDLPYADGIKSAGMKSVAELEAVCRQLEAQIQKLRDDAAFTRRMLLGQKTVTARVRVPGNWAGPCCWAWSGKKGNAFDAWPGEALREEGSWYTVQFPAWVDEIVINANGGAIQTCNQPVDQGVPFWMVVKDTRDIAVYYEEPSEEDAECAPEEAPDDPAPAREDGAYRIDFKQTQGENH